MEWQPLSLLLAASNDGECLGFQKLELVRVVKADAVKERYK